mmetsp:Transcript_22929/g.54135  ORF Transcript_22929/g.54135 Transcript_22929/m.54135 type:complete len:372 (-) Transcript_22929:72-1187(-)
MATDDDAVVVDPQVACPCHLYICQGHFPPSRQVVPGRGASLRPIHRIDVQYHIFRQVISPANRVERALPIFRCWDVKTPQSDRVHKSYSIRDLVAEHERRGAIQGRAMPLWYMHNIVDADRAQLAHNGVLEVELIAVRIVGDQVPRLLDLRWDMGLNKVSEALCVALGLEEEVEALARLLQRCDLGVGVALEDELLQVAEGPSVWHLLPHLDDSVVSMGRERLLAIFTLLVDDLEFDNHCLLKDAGLRHLFLHGDLHSYPHGVLLGPDESSINKPDFFADASNLLQTNAQQLPRLGLAGGPAWLVVPTTVAASLEHHAPGDSVRDGNLRFEALGAKHGLVRNHGHSAAAAERCRHAQRRLHRDVMAPLHAH